MLGLLRIMLLGTFVNRFLCGPVFSFLLETHTHTHTHKHTYIPRSGTVEFLSHIIMMYLTF